MVSAVQHKQELDQEQQLQLQNVETVQLVITQRKIQQQVMYQPAINVFQTAQNVQLPVNVIHAMTVFYLIAPMMLA